jgi:hypothetical protein
MKSSISESGEDSWADDTHHIFVTPPGITFLSDDIERAVATLEAAEGREQANAALHRKTTLGRGLHSHRAGR